MNQNKRKEAKQKNRKKQNGMKVALNSKICRGQIEIKIINEHEHTHVCGTVSRPNRKLLPRSNATFLNLV